MRTWSRWARSLPSDPKHNTFQRNKSWRRSSVLQAPTTWRSKACNHFKESSGAVPSCVAGSSADNHICEVSSADSSPVLIILPFESMPVAFLSGLSEDGKCFSKEFLVLDDTDVASTVASGFSLGKWGWITLAAALFVEASDALCSSEEISGIMARNNSVRDWRESMWFWPKFRLSGTHYGKFWKLCLGSWKYFSIIEYVVPGKEHLITKGNFSFEKFTFCQKK